MQTAQINRGLHIKSSCALHRELFLNITIMSRNLLHLPTSVNSNQDTVSHILVVHQWMLCLCEFIIGFYIAMLLLNLRMIGDDRSELNLFMQHGLVAIGYDSNSANRICKFVIAHCNDERMLNGIYNDIRNSFNNYSEVYEDVKSVLEKFVQSKGKVAKRESQVRSFFGQHFKKKIYVDCKEEIIQIILKSETKQQVNNGLLKLYSDGTVVSHIYKTIQPLISELPGKRR